MSTPSIPLTPDQRAKRWGTAAKVIALAIFGFFVAPFILQSIAGLIGVAILGILGLVGWSLLPVIGSVAANMRMILIKREAAKNPVPTLQNDLREKTVALDERKTAIDQLDARIRTLDDKVADIKTRYGVNDPGYVKLNGDLGSLNRVLLQRRARWKDAYVALKQYAEEIDRVSIIWDASIAAAAAAEASGLSEGEFWSRVKTETAFEAIQSNYNGALASLDSSLMQDDAEKMVGTTVHALPAPSERVIDVQSAPIATPVRTRRL